MIDSKVKDITELLLKKRDLVSDILKITESTQFFGDEKDADNYIFLIDKRQDLISQILVIDKELDKEPVASMLKNPNEELENNIYSINHAITQYSHKIIELDKSTSNDVERIMASLKKELKSIKEAKNINSLYQNDSQQESGNYFDTRK